MRRRDFVRAAGLIGAAGLAPAAVARQTGSETTIRVPDDRDTVQAGVDAAGEGDLVLVAEGTYAEAVRITTPGITLRGRDRNAVVLDGEFGLGNAVTVRADGVAVENLTVRHYQNNAVYWNGVEGFRGSFLTAHNNGYYGIYATHSRDGRFEYCYASGHPDAGFYLGRNQPYEAVVEGVVAEYNGLGYSGTSTGADLTIRDSVFRHNMAGIVPNTLDRADPPQHSSTIVGNVVYDNGNEDAPTEAHTYPMFGTGICLWGANDNRVADNVVDGHPNYGIAANPNVVDPSGNVVRDNVVRASGRADLALGAPAGGGNEFIDNLFATSTPSNIVGDAADGSDAVTAVYDRQERRAGAGNYPAGDWRDQPAPGDLPTMADPEAPPRPATKTASWADDGSAGDG